MQIKCATLFPMLLLGDLQQAKCQMKKLVLNSTKAKELRFTKELYIPAVLHDDWGKDSYVEIALRQFEQQLLPPELGFGKTTVWGYGNRNVPGSFHHPSGTVEVTLNKKTTVKWVNELVKDPVKCRKFPRSDACNYLEHLIKDEFGDPKVDTSLHWANPPQDCKSGCKRTDCRGKNKFVYKGPVPMVVHVHGSHVRPESDGYPESWFLPKSNNIPYGYATTGTYYRSLKTNRYLRELEMDREDADEEEHLRELEMDEEDADEEERLWHTQRNEENPGHAVFQYTNDQEATCMLWYHDHTLGVTERNAEAALAGLWIIRTETDSESGLSKFSCDRKRQYLPGPPVKIGQDPNVLTGYQSGVRRELGEIPLIINPMGFYEDGSFYPGNFFDQPNIMLVNGCYWPKLKVGRKRYRFRLLFAGSSSHVTLKITFSLNDLGENGEDVPFYVTGSDQSHLPRVVKLTKDSAKFLSCGVEEDYEYPDNKDFEKRFFGGLPVGIGERYDILLDFSKFKHGDRIYMNNRGDDIQQKERDDPMDLLKEIMVFEVDSSYDSRQVYVDKSTPPEKLRFEQLEELGKPVKKRDVTVDATLVPGEGLVFLLGSDGQLGNPDVTLGDDNQMFWEDPIDTVIKVDTVEEWHFWTWSGDHHPIHIHQVAFRITGRSDTNKDKINDEYPWETGYKDMIISEGGSQSEPYVNTVKARFDIRGLYVYHCHILGHEDNEMMLPICVGVPGIDCPAELFRERKTCS